MSITNKQDPSTTGCRVVEALIKFLNARDNGPVSDEVSNELAAAINGVDDVPQRLRDAEDRRLGDKT